MIKRRGFITVFFLAALIICADEKKIVVLLHPLTWESSGGSDFTLIESLLSSYLSSMTGLSVIREPEETRETGVAGELDGTDMPGGIDFELSGSINNDGVNNTITLNVKNMRTDEVTVYTSVHKNSSELVLRLRSIAQALFSEPVPFVAGEDGDIEAEPVTAASLAGLWHAGTGIEMVNFQRDGSAIAFFSSGERMNLKYIIEGRRLKIIQNTPNRERYYFGLSYNIARELTLGAKPLRFELSLFDNGLVLRGKQIETVGAESTDGSVTLIHDYERAAEWKRHIR
jgi:hypothetical protein